MSDTPTRRDRPPAPAGVRAHVASLADATAGQIVPLDPAQARHLVRARRLGDGATVVAFDDAGRAAPAVLCDRGGAWTLRLTADATSNAGDAGDAALTVYAAVPKGARADWMVEKLCELGVGRFVPLACARSVVEPGGGKLARFARVAREAAKQSRRRGVMRVDALTPLAAAIDEACDSAAVLTTEQPGGLLWALAPAAVFVGPEGGWTPDELEAFAAAGVAPATLGETVLRVETAAVAAASLWSARAGGWGDTMPRADRPDP